MTPPVLVSGDPGEVWRLGFAPDPWAWPDWKWARDAGRFDGRWDDQLAAFRTLYTSESLLGCFLELLARLRPNTVAFDELDAIEDDDDQARAYPSPERGAVGYDWLGDRRFGHGTQPGVYAEVTSAQTLAYLTGEGVFDRLGIPPQDVDVALLKNARDRTVTRTVARFLYDQRNPDRSPLVDGIAFRSRMGDELRLWAVFEREDVTVSEQINPDPETHQVTEDIPELLEAFELLGLHWQGEA